MSGYNYHNNAQLGYNVTHSGELLGGGRHMNSYIHMVIMALKKSEKPMNLENICMETGVNLIENSELYKAVINTDRIELWDGKLVYVPKYKIKTREELLNTLKEQPEPGGLYFSELKNCDPNIETMLNELESTNDIIILQHKDVSQKTIYYNKYKEKPVVDPLFKNMWHKIQLPLEGDLEKELDDAGLKSIILFESSIANNNMKKKNRKNRSRRVKLTNTHLNIDLTKDITGKETH